MFTTDLLTLEHRQKMMRVAFEPVEIEVNQHGRVLVRKKATDGLESIYLAGAGPPGAVQGRTKGWMTAYFIPEHLTLMALAVRDTQPMIWVPPTPDNDDVMTSLRYAATRVSATEDVRQQLTVLGRQQASSLQDLDYDSTIERLPEFVNTVYTNYALSAIPDKTQRSNTAELLARKGLYDLLDRSGDALVTLVEISLWPFLNEESRPVIEKGLSAQGIVMDKALKVIESCQRRTGMPLLATVSNRTISLV